jgi:hypothetical protein
MFERQSRSHHRRTVAALVLLGALVALLVPFAGPSRAAASYYFSSAGSDSSPTCSMSTPCRTLAKASALPLNAGDQVYFRKTDSWVGRLEVTRSGASTARIVVGSYGTGARPRISGGADFCVRLGGNWLTLDGLDIANCGWSGVKVEGDNVIVRNLSVTGNAAGVYVTYTADNGLYERNVLVDNNRMSAGKTGPDDDSGAFGFLIHGNGNVFGWNEVRGSDAPSPDYARDGAAFEIYGASNTVVHHNLSVDNDTFTELGKSSSDPSSDGNRFEYNTIYSDERGTESPRAGSAAKALVTAAGGGRGPITNTAFRNNSVRLTGNGNWRSRVEAIMCYGGCTASHLELRTNAVRVSGTSSTTGLVKSGFANSNFNVFWPSLPVNLTKGAFDVVADPKFVSNTNLRLLDSTSPAVDRGCTVYWRTDRDGQSVPVDIAGRDNGPACAEEPDAGAYEQRATVTTVAPSPRYDDAGTEGDLSAAAFGTPWPRHSLTFAYANGTDDIEGIGERLAIRDAFDLWALATPLTFTEVSMGATPAPDIVIAWAAGAHGDEKPFDGPYNTLAHAGSPPDGDIHFDEAETWTVSGRGTDRLQPIDLVTVAAHEIGHSLGLAHSRDLSSLMAPAYTGSHRFLSDDDRRRIQGLYGSLGVCGAGRGYWLVTGAGGILPYGDARFYGTTGGVTPTKPIVGVAATRSGAGYWMVSSDGNVLPSGDARSYGSTAGMTLNRPIVGMAATSSGAGYWLVASDGGIFAYGDARFYGSTGGTTLNKPIVGMAATPSGAGYWLVASDGGVFAYGDARFFGSMGGKPLNQPVVGMAATPSGAGYWLVASDGGIFAYGDARFFGSTGGTTLNKPIVGMASSPTGAGYWLVAADGGIFAYGDAPFCGSAGGKTLPSPIVGMAGYLKR